jgi:anti-sigma factor RsiW
MSDTDEMACQELVEVVTDYLDGTLEPADRRRFEEHLAVCAGCRNYLEQMRATIRVTGGLKAENIPAGMRAQLLEAFRGWKRAGA